MHEAAKRGFTEILEVLLQQKPDLSIRDSKGSTALQVCVCVYVCVYVCITSVQMEVKCINFGCVLVPYLVLMCALLSTVH